METLKKIRKWSIERGLDNEDPKGQMLKLVEELGELSEGISKGKEELIVDGLGDCVVVLTILAQQYGLVLEDCINYAYNEIKDRKGLIVDGVYVKESDLEC